MNINNININSFLEKDRKLVKSLLKNRQYIELKELIDSILYKTYKNKDKKYCNNEKEIELYKIELDEYVDNLYGDLNIDSEINDYLLNIKEDDY